MKNENEIEQQKDANSGVYVFHGIGAKFACAVYDNLDDATRDINRLKLSGLLTYYPIGQSVLEFVTQQGLLTPKESPTPGYIQNFTSAHLEHYHFENGNLS